MRQVLPPSFLLIGSVSPPNFGSTYRGQRITTPLCKKCLCSGSTLMHTPTGDSYLSFYRLPENFPSFRKILPVIAEPRSSLDCPPFRGDSSLFCLFCIGTRQKYIADGICFSPAITVALPPSPPPPKSATSVSFFFVVYVNASASAI